MNHPIYNAFGAGDYLNNLKGEYYGIHAKLRRKWFVKYLRRALLLAITGQTCLQKAAIPAGTRKILWFYDWNTLGDSIMDLSQRQALASRYQVDICMPKGPAELFQNDPAFAHVYTDINDCPKDYDFILLHDISSTSIGIKLSKYLAKPWASMINHQQGEQQGRVALSAFRLSQLLQTPVVPHRPQLNVQGLSRATVVPNSVAVALGGIEHRRRILTWAPLLEQIYNAALKTGNQLRFTLMGSGPEAGADLTSIPPEFVAQHCQIQMNLPNLSALKTAVLQHQYFIGCDSGLMHMAEALDKPGVALFGVIKPEWRLLESSRLVPLFDTVSVNNIPQDQIVAAFMRAIPTQNQP